MTTLSFFYAVPGSCILYKINHKILIYVPRNSKIYRVPNTPRCQFYCVGLKCKRRQFHLICQMSKKVLLISVF